MARAPSRRRLRVVLKLQDLEPRFLKIVDESRRRYIEDISEADGLIFLCPKCFAENGGRVGTHSIICWRPHVSQDALPKPGRWDMRGSGFFDLSLVAGSSSIALMGGCNAHFFIENGLIRNA
jgi:hypothetical protein